MLFSKKSRKKRNRKHKKKQKEINSMLEEMPGNKKPLFSFLNPYLD